MPVAVLRFAAEVALPLETACGAVPEDAAGTTAFLSAVPGRSAAPFAVAGVVGTAFCAEGCVAFCAVFCAAFCVVACAAVSVAAAWAVALSACAAARPEANAPLCGMDAFPLDRAPREPAAALPLEALEKSDPNAEPAEVLAGVACTTGEDTLACTALAGVWTEAIKTAPLPAPALPALLSLRLPVLVVFPVLAVFPVEDAPCDPACAAEASPAAASATNVCAPEPALALAAALAEVFEVVPAEAELPVPLVSLVPVCVLVPFCVLVPACASAGFDRFGFDAAALLLFACPEAADCAPALWAASALAALAWAALFGFVMAGACTAACGGTGWLEACAGTGAAAAPCICCCMASAKLAGAVAPVARLCTGAGAAAGSAAGSTISGSACKELSLSQGNLQLLCQSGRPCLGNG
jgi:hypothetical protein